MNKLYELSQAYAELLLKLDDADGDSAQAIKDTLDALDCSIEEKAENGIKLIKTLEGQCEMYKSEYDRLKKLHDSAERRISALKEYYKTNLLIADKKSVQTSVGVMRVQSNGNGSVTILNETLIPADYIRVIPEKKEPDKKAIADFIKSGGTVPGAEYVVGKSLRIS